MNLISKYRDDISNAYKKLESQATVLLDTSFGTVEYAIHEGVGIPILVVHGIVGGFDQALQTGLSLVGQENTILGISRFGYLGSDLPTNPTPENQAKAYAEVLDMLNLDEVFLLATSAGGTPCLKFALLYPDRVKGIILVGSGAPTNMKTKGPSGPPKFIYNDFVFWLLLSKFKPMMMSMFGVSEEEFNVADEDERMGLLNLFDVILPIKPRRPGILVDERITNPDMIINYEEYKVEDIECPLLILHAMNDPMAKYDNMEAMVKRLKDVEFVEYETGGHVLFGHGHRNTQVIKKFFGENS